MPEPTEGTPQKKHGDLKTLIVNDLNDRQTWAKKQDEIAKRRLGARRKQKQRPYVGAPNFVVPIIDDNVREKTDQEVTMILNAPVMAHAITVGPGVDAATRSKIERGFDSYLRHIVKFRPKIEEALDTKNARGFSILKQTRNDINRLSQDLSTAVVIDPKDLIVPRDTKEIGAAERLTHVVRYNARTLKKAAKQYDWDMTAVNAVIAASRQVDDERRADDNSEEDVLDATADLIGLATSGTGKTSTIVVWQCYHYASKDDAARNADDEEIREGKRIVTIFAPNQPDHTLAEFAWKELDRFEELNEQEAQIEIQKAIAEDREPDLTRRIPGEDRPWPFVQPRFEQRSGYFYDTRGIGELNMDNQIKATQIENAKSTLTDYSSSPMYQGNGGSRNSSNISFRPGSRVPVDFKWVDPVKVPQNLNFDINDTKMDAGRRAGAASQYMYSSDSGSRKLQKTATESKNEQQRVNLVSSASVDRFNDPISDIYQLIWDDLRRMKPRIPVIENGVFTGEALEGAIWDIPVMWVSAGSAKTLNPDFQLAKSQAMANFAVSLMQAGLPADAMEIWNTVSSYWDSNLTRDWVVDPQAAGPQGQPPIFQQLQAIQQQMQQFGQVLQQMNQGLEASLKLSQENAERIDRLEESQRNERVAPRVA